jgi:hypothetical protein
MAVGGIGWGKLLIEVQRPFLIPPRFHGAPGVEAAPRRAGQNSCADNELAGAPEEIRTPDPQIRSLRSSGSRQSRRSGRTRSHRGRSAALGCHSQQDSQSPEAMALRGLNRSSVRGRRPDWSSACRNGGDALDWSAFDQLVLSVQVHTLNSAAAHADGVAQESSESARLSCEAILPLDPSPQVVRLSHSRSSIKANRPTLDRRVCSCCSRSG